MALTPQQKQARANARAKALGFSSDYDRRRARAKERGFSSPRAQRTASEKQRGVQRDYALERENADRRARARGFLSATDQRKFRKSGAADVIGYQRENTLRQFGITKYEFDRMRRANRNHSPNEKATIEYNSINAYDHQVDSRIHDWSPDRVGYIVYYNRAIVDPKTNFDSLLESGKRMGKRYSYRRLTKEGKPLTNKENYYYLVKYANIMEVNEFEARYGSNQIPQ